MFIDQVADAINQALYEQVANGIVYRPTGDGLVRGPVSEIATRTRRSRPGSSPVTKSITDHVVCDSEVEEQFAEFLDARDDVPLFVKLPDWFKIPTPLGNYNPDWAFVREEDGGQALYLVRETKGTDRHREAPVGVGGLEDQVRPALTSTRSASTTPLVMNRGC